MQAGYTRGRPENTPEPFRQWGWPFYRGLRRRCERLRKDLRIEQALLPQVDPQSTAGVSHSSGQGGQNQKTQALESCRRGIPGVDPKTHPSPSGNGVGHSGGGCADVGPPMYVINVIGPPMYVINVIRSPLYVIDKIGPPMYAINAIGPPLYVINVIGPPMYAINVIGPPIYVVNVIGCPESENAGS